MPRIKVLISGAGIAGNALAFWLAKLGHDVTVVERTPGLRAAGLQIDLRSHGIEVMRRMGLEAAFRAKVAPEQGIQIVDGAGRRKAFFPANKPGTATGGFTTANEIMRGDLVRLLFDASKARKNVTFLFGQSVEHFAQQDDSPTVAVRFSDGRTATFDLLIGADGQNSRTRRALLPPDAKDPFIPLGGQYVGYFTVAAPLQPDEEYVATAFFATRRRGVMTRRHSAAELQVYLGLRTADEALVAARRSGDVAAQKAALDGLLRGAGWRVDEFLEKMHASENFYCEELGVVQLDKWARGRVTLVGDAAYCPSPNTGMGTTAGIVGAYILAGEIGKAYGRVDGEEWKEGGDGSPDGLPAALKAYQDRFQPFMTEVQKEVLEDSGFASKIPTSQFGITLLNWALGLASFLKINFFNERDVKGWDLPEYEELKGE